MRQKTEEKLKVLHVTPSMSPAWGGPAPAVAELAAALAGQEMLGIAVLEALAARVPVVITTGCEFPEISEYGAGLSAEADTASIAHAMEQLLTDKELRRSMGEQGHKLVTERYT